MVRLVDSDHDRALEAAEALPEARAFCAHAFDPEFLERERIGNASAAVSASTTAPRTSTPRCSRAPTASA